jgi:hypothetical protein
MQLVSHGSTSSRGRGAPRPSSSLTELVTPSTNAVTLPVVENTGTQERTR